MNLGRTAAFLRTRAARLEWALRHRSAPSATPVGPPRRVLLLPCDAATVTGSRGDEAMMLAAVARLRQLRADVVIGVHTHHAAASAAVAARGWQPVQHTSRVWAVQPVLRAAADFAPDLCLAIGGDVMDGHYSELATLRLLAGADALTRRGTPATVLGFSFNARPLPALRQVFAGLGAGVALKVRDPFSLRRLQAFAPTARAELVADMAFLLPPGDPAGAAVAPLLRWAGVERSAGRLVIGFNFHPALGARGAAVAQALDGVLQRHPLSLLLLPHDDRGEAGDAACLAPLHRALAPRWGTRVRLAASTLRAGDAKTVAAAMDAVVAGRMHLAVAALGSGVPTAGFVYQDKFAGLFDHFGLADSGLLLDAAAMQPAAIEALLQRVIEGRAGLAAQIGRTLPQVEELAARNLPRPGRVSSTRSDNSRPHEQAEPI